MVALVPQGMAWIGRRVEALLAVRWLWQRQVSELPKGRGGSTVRRLQGWAGAGSCISGVALLRDCRVPVVGWVRRLRAGIGGLACVGGAYLGTPGMPLVGGDWDGLAQPVLVPRGPHYGLPRAGTELCRCG